MKNPIYTVLWYAYWMLVWSIVLEVMYNLLENAEHASLNTLRSFCTNFINILKAR